MREFRARSVMATFAREEEAEKALEALKKAGFQDGQVDEVSRRRDESGFIQDQPWPASLTQKHDEDSRVLAAADPAVSGSTTGGEGLIGGEHRFLLTQPLRPGENADKAADVIRRNGGNVDGGGPR